MEKKKETKEERFQRLAEARTNKLIHMIRLLGNMASPSNYDYPLKWVDQIFTQLREELDKAEKRLRERHAPHNRKRFSLTHPSEDDAPDATRATESTHWVFDSPSSYYCSACGTVGKDYEPTTEDRYCRYCGRQIVGHSEHRYDPSDIDEASSHRIDFAGGE